MANYSVTDYKLFDDLINNNTELYKKLDDVILVINNQVDILKKDNFNGVLFDNSIDYLNKYKNSFSSIVNDLKLMNSELKEIRKDYKARDKKASAAASNNNSSSTNQSGKKYTSNNTPNVIPVVTPSSKYPAYKNPCNVHDYRLTFINAIRDKAIEMYDKYGLLPSVTMGHAIMESGWGIKTEGNNLYNIRTYSDDRMFVDDGLTGTYRSYNSIYDAMEDYGYFLTVERKERYAPLVAANSYQEAAKQIIECGFGTDRSYPQKLINLISKYGLDQWDYK